MYLCLWHSEFAVCKAQTAQTHFVFIRKSSLAVEYHLLRNDLCQNCYQSIYYFNNFTFETFVLCMKFAKLFLFLNTFVYKIYHQRNVLYIDTHSFKFLNFNIKMYYCEMID